MGPARGDLRRLGGEHAGRARRAGRAAARFIGQVADDQLGEVFAHDIRAGGIDFATPARAGEPPTARCLIFVTPDGQRTMNTFLGASQFLPAERARRGAIAAAAVLYLEGYLWDPEEPRAAMRRAIDAARGAGRKVAFTLSDAFVIDRHGDDFRALIDDGRDRHPVRQRGRTGRADRRSTISRPGSPRLRRKVPVLVVTRGAQGAVALAAASARQVAGRADRQGGRHHRRGRPVRRRLPLRPRRAASRSTTA